MCNPYCQPDVRKREMCRLLDDEQPAALRAVLKRFNFNSNGGIADEEEKKWLENQLSLECVSRLYTNNLFCRELDSEHVYN